MDKRNRITVNFRMSSKEEEELFNWVKQNGAVGGDSVFIKNILYKEYLKQEGKK